MFGMNPVQIEKIVRTFLTVAGTIAMTFGWLTSGQVEGYTAIILQILGPLTTVGTLIWTIVSGTQASQVNAVLAMPEVKKIELAPTVAGAALEKATLPGAQVVR